MRGVFRRRVGSVRAVDGLDFAIYPRETLGLVGESGCGKSTVGRVILRLYPPTAGRVTFRGEDITALQGEALRKLRPHMQMIFQGLCCKLGEGAMRDQGASCSPYDSALARRSCSHAMASVRAHGPRPKARSTIRASPTMPPWRANIPAWPLRSARITSKPLIVA